jgi:ureidoacrylate peracid hydrolase
MNDFAVLRTLSDKIRPSHTALVIVDMLNDYVDPSGKAATRAQRPISVARSIIPVVQKLLAAAREHNVLVAHIMQTVLPNGLSDSGPWTDSRTRATYCTSDLGLDGTWGQEVIPELAPAANEAVVKKYRFSGFVGTNLDLVLRSHGILTTIVCGVSTNVCVEATARDAFSHEYYVVLPPDACASWDTELHHASLRTASQRYAVIPSVDEILDVWSPVREKALR